MMQVGVSWHVYLLTRSPVWLGLLGACRAIPLVALALFGGLAADVVDRRRLLLATEAVLLAISALLAVCTALDVATPYLLYACVGCIAATTAFDNPARASLVPSLVPPEHLTNAISLNILAWQTATVLGPPVAGFVIAALDIEFVYVIDALSFLAMLYAAYMLPRGSRMATAVGSGLASIREGIAFVLSKPVMTSTMLLDFLATFFGAATTLLPIFASEILGVGPEGLGFLLAAPAAGAVMAGLVLASLRDIKRQGLAVLWSVAAYGLATVAFGLSTLMATTLLALACAGAADAVSTVLRQTIRQTITPDELRGRMTSLNMICFMGGPQLGELEAGLMAAWVGPAMSVTLGGVGVLVTVVAFAALSPRLRRYVHGPAP